MVSNNLLRRIPVTIGKLVNLQTLDLEENNLESLPQEIEHLTQVSFIYTRLWRFFLLLVCRLVSHRERGRSL